MTIMQLDHVNFTYASAAKRVLSNVSYDFEVGTFYAIVGSSGAGKTTMLSLLAGLDAPTQGAVLFDGKDLATTGYTRHRRDQIALVFQNYNLIDYLTPLENLRLVNPKASVEDLTRLGIDEAAAKRNVLALSGGQQQRVAIGRALVSSAPVILADEPTGNLDEDTAQGVIEILRDAAHEQNKCVIVVTHSRQLARAADVTLRLEQRKLVERKKA
ncbi:putative ABC transport system ATP-binding protein [Brevibacterium paucivorans]|uniref:ABC transport system ATP-binding protein n=1 Tax=Brevibacterium paucivorans TaxID=170994 RepID=A0ABS2SMB3_9MICO|nr:MULTISPECIES: ABC transporter ATP-binding protein [Brevibacterium]MBM7817396.1 putative ABC transport system ATP-binding protein [Brevibacterium paucivorans]MCG7299406.1 ABC transporter ATP-binding protein [Brevibacterium sp. ACRRH]MDK7750088.1 ABC transporter ATP-binding protein [Brevibacterium sp. UMB10442]